MTTSLTSCIICDIFSAAVNKVKTKVLQYYEISLRSVLKVYTVYLLLVFHLLLFLVSFPFRD